MQCLSPFSRRNPKGTSNADRITVPCGKCLSCLSRRRSSWSFRLKKELDVATSAYFITLTYDDDHLPHSDCGAPVVCKKDVQLFFKRFRKKLYPVKIRYFLVSEYGENTHRPHYHLILFNFPRSLDLSVFLNKSWIYGHCHVGSVTSASIHYVTKYCLALDDVSDEIVRPFMLCSTKPALGSNYLTSAMKTWHIDGLRSYVMNDGFKQCLPRYYRDKIFDEFQKEDIRNIQLKSIRQAEMDYDNKYGEYDERVQRGLSSMLNEQKQDYIRKKKNQMKKNSKF